MPSAIVNATIQSALLSGLSNVLAQAITLYRGQVCLATLSVDYEEADVLHALQKPLHLNIVAVIQFVTFTLINCPPNYLWQEYLEDRYPGFTTTNSQMARSPEKPNPAGAKSLNVRNTITKFVLDMTLGAAVNTVLFIAVIGALKGLDGNDILEAIQRVRQIFSIYSKQRCATTLTADSVGLLAHNRLWSQALAARFFTQFYRRACREAYGCRQSFWGPLGHIPESAGDELIGKPLEISIPDVPKTCHRGR